MDEFNINTFLLGYNEKLWDTVYMRFYRVEKQEWGGSPLNQQIKQASTENWLNK